MVSLIMDVLATALEPKVQLKDQTRYSCNGTRECFHLGTSNVVKLQ